MQLKDVGHTKFQITELVKSGRPSIFRVRGKLGEHIEIINVENARRSAWSPDTEVELVED